MVSGDAVTLALLRKRQDKLNKFAPLILTNSTYDYSVDRNMPSVDNLTAQNVLN